MYVVFTLSDIKSRVSELLVFSRHSYSALYPTSRQITVLTLIVAASYSSAKLCHFSTASLLLVTPPLNDALSLQNTVSVNAPLGIAIMTERHAIYWRFSTAWYGTVHFWGVFHWVQYLVLFLVPPRPRFQASHTVTKTWPVNSDDHWLAAENRHYLRHETQQSR